MSLSISPIPDNFLCQSDICLLGGGDDQATCPPVGSGPCSLSRPSSQAGNPRWPLVCDVFLNSGGTSSSRRVDARKACCCLLERRKPTPNSHGKPDATCQKERCGERKKHGNIVKNQQCNKRI